MLIAVQRRRFGSEATAHVEMSDFANVPDGIPRPVVNVMTPMRHFAKSDPRSIPSNADRGLVHGPFLVRTVRLRRAHSIVLVAAMSIAELSWLARAIRSIRITEH